MKSKLRPSLRPVSACLFLISALFPVLSSGQDTLRVIYHDFQQAHRDFAGPNVAPWNDAPQQKCNGGLNSNIVQATLPADKVPVLTANPGSAAERAECLDLNIRSWFKPVAGQQGFHKTFPGYLLDQGRPNDGLFEFDSQAFYPIDSVKGAEIYPNGHNNLFCLEVHEDFRYVGGEIFNFRGDDDVWLFINNKLALDIGGLHTPVAANLNLDASAGALGIVKGGTYDFDFYYCERQYVGSSIRITTNIPIASPSKVATPIADPPAKSFDSQESIRLSTPTAGAIIYYTLNGATPDSSSTLYNPNSPIVVTTTTTIKAIAYKTDWLKSDVLTQVYTKKPNENSLEILDQNGNPLPGGYITELNSSYTIKVSTTQAGLATLTSNVGTKIAGDQENVALANRISQGNGFVFTGTSPFKILPATPSDATTQASVYDSLIVRWVNPTNPLDGAEKRILVRPSPIQARAFFATDSNGTNPVDQFAGTETTLYVFVIDEVLRATEKPTITLTTVPLNPSPTHTRDTATLDLIAVSPGKYRAIIPVQASATNTADKNLQLLLDDQITATYVDPMDKDVAVANAGYGTAPEIAGTLQFTDSLGVPVPVGAHYSPAEGKLYLSYRDDYLDVAPFLKKTVTLTIVNNFGKAANDSETFTVDLVPAKKSGSAGIWEGSLTLEDGPAIAKGNNTAESYVLGDVVAVVQSHGKNGNALGPVSDNLLVAYPDKEAVITLEGPAGPGVKVTRADPSVTVRLNEQSVSSARDTLYGTLTCTESRDVIENVMLIEKADAPGQYESVLISKTEIVTALTPSQAQDRALQCNSRDIIEVTYKDPIYGDPKKIQVFIDAPVTTKLYFSTKPDGSDEITSVADLDADFFYAVVLARSPEVAKVDAFGITFTTTQGESETFEAVETGPYTEKFIVKVPFAFVTGAIAGSNGTLEGKITPKEISNFVTATGSVTVEGNTVKAPIDLLAAFALAQKAYIKDMDGNGQADRVFIVFDKKLGRLPATVSAQWNDSIAPGKIVTGAKISFLDSDSMVVVVDYKDSPFAMGLTASVPGSDPRALLPNDALFKAQRPVIEDSLGPMILKAVKTPANLKVLTTKDPGFNLDTLTVTLSEPLKTADFRQMLKFASNCNDYAHAKTIEAANNPVPTADKPTEYKVIVNNSTGLVPQTGSCVFLNADPDRYSDVPGNSPNKTGVVLEGGDRNNIIQLFRGYPPVAGLDPNQANFQAAVQDSRDSTKSGFATQVAAAWEVRWIPPVGFVDDSSKTFVPYSVSGPKQIPSSTPDRTPIQSLPRYISTIQVKSTAPYVANINIFDNHGNFVRSSVQAFGYQGEMQNTDRVVPGGVVSYLVWDMKDKDGQLAGQGVYVWKVRFEFQNGKQEIRYTRTGLMRKHAR